MSDIYDYAYMHIMRQPAEVNNYTSSSRNDLHSEHIVVNTEDFSPRDLQLFVDSMETITRLKKAKYERRQSFKIRSHQESFENSKKIVTCLDSTMACTTYDTVAKSSYTTESDYIYDEPYYGTPYQSQSNASYSNINGNSLKYFLSDSEESGVFLNNTEESNFYEDIEMYPIRPRSNVISHPKCKSLKSRLISLIMKKQYVQPAAPIADILSSTTYGEDTEGGEIYDRVLDEVIQHQFAKNSKRGKRKYRMSRKKPECVSIEEKFLDKALRSLAL